jgi:hypothetical protein
MAQKPVVHMHLGSDYKTLCGYKRFTVMFSNSVPSIERAYLAVKADTQMDLCATCSRKALSLYKPEGTTNG